MLHETFGAVNECIIITFRLMYDERGSGDGECFGVEIFFQIEQLGALLIKRIEIAGINVVAIEKLAHIVVNLVDRVGVILFHERPLVGTKERPGRRQRTLSFIYRAVIAVIDREAI